MPVTCPSLSLGPRCHALPHLTTIESESLASYSQLRYSASHTDLYPIFIPSTHNPDFKLSDLPKGAGEGLYIWISVPAIFNPDFKLSGTDDRT